MAKTDTSGGRHKAGAFDIRNFIGSLLAIYGVILTVYGFFPAGQAPEKTGGINANLIIGVLLLVAGAIFMGWARAKPVVVPDHTERDGDDRPPMHH